MIAALMVATLSTNAQGMFIKPMAGGSLATMTGDVEHLKMKLGFVGGVELGYQVNDFFALTAGALYTMQGAKFDSDKTKYNINLDYLNVPVMLAVYPVEGFGIKAGAQFGFLMKAKRSEDDIKDFYKKSDFTIPVGLSYEFEDAAIDLRYHIPVSNIYDSNNVDIKNSLITLTIGYKIPM